MKVRAFLPALLIAAALFVSATRSAQAAPALWLVQSPVAKVYLFGTVHVLRDGTTWRSPQLEAAIAESQDLYLEIADPANAGTALTSLAKIGFDREHPLSTKISKADVDLLTAAAKKYGLGSEAAFEPMEPWLAYMMVAMLPSMHSGYSASNGVDVQIRKEFVAAGKPVHGFETFDQQAHIFADLPETEQVGLLDYQLRHMSPQSVVGPLDTIVKVWLSGNQDDLEKILQLDKPSQTETAFEEKVVTNRNKAWANALSERLKQPGTSFVSVGAAHLVGTDGVPALLARMGYTVTRVQIPDDATIASPSASPSASPGAPSSPASPTPSPAASATPIPQTLTPPPGWKGHKTSFTTGTLSTDYLWADPKRGLIVTGHLDLPGISSMDLDALDAFFHQGLVAGVGSKGTVQPSAHVKICNGKQDGTYSKISTATLKQDIVLAVSDRGYLAQYMRPKNVADDPAAIQSILSLCAP